MPFTSATRGETVVSAAFELKVDADIATPFALGLTVHFSADLVVPASKPNAAFNYSDICLGELVELPLFGFAYWECVITDEATRLTIPVYNSTRDAGLPSTVLTGYVNHAGVYAFIRSPVPGTATSSRTHVCC